MHRTIITKTCMLLLGHCSGGFSKFRFQPGKLSWLPPSPRFCGFNFLLFTHILLQNTTDYQFMGLLVHVLCSCLCKRSIYCKLILWLHHPGKGCLLNEYLINLLKWQTTISVFFVHGCIRWGAKIMTEASFCRPSKEIQEIASSTYFGKPLSQLHKQHFESVMPISFSAMFKEISPGKGMWLVLQPEYSVHKNVLSSGLN